MATLLPASLPSMLGQRRRSDPSCSLLLFFCGTPHSDPIHLHPAPTDIEENGVRLKLTVVDTPGFGDFVNNDDS
jgi:septin family protein